MNSDNLNDEFNPDRPTLISITKGVGPEDPPFDYDNVPVLSFARQDGTTYWRLYFRDGRMEVEGDALNSEEAAWQLFEGMLKQLADRYIEEKLRGRVK